MTPTETEAVLDRRRMARRITTWRGAAIVFGALALMALAGSDVGGLVRPGQIARVSIEGLITEDRKQLKLLEKLASEDYVKGVILAVNSPGGTTTGGEALFIALRHLAEKKPVVAQFGTVAASAAYMAGLACDHIVSRGNTITGSVGVIVQWPEVTALLDKIGVKMNEVKSGPLKASPSPFEPLNDSTRKLTQDMVSEGQKWFNSLVAERRGIDPAAVPGLTDGRIYSGREALSLKLVDEIGGESEAVRWLEDQRHIPKKLKIVDRKPRRDDGYWFGEDFSHALAGFVVDVVSEASGRLTGWPASGIRLDGLLSVWQPQQIQ